METRKYKENEYINIVNDLNKGLVVGFPTETVYGLAIVYDSIEAFKSLYEIKHREITKPISMMVYDKNTIQKVAEVSIKQQKVIDKLMPGPLTIVLKAKNNLPSFVTFNKPTIGIRIPTNKTALNVLCHVGKPLLVTSANLSNSESLINWDDVYNTFNGQISSLIMENASLKVASTVVDLCDDKVKILRQGPITEDEIIAAMEE